MNVPLKNRKSSCNARYPALRILGLRALFLFVDFFLIIMAVYQLKPASRSLYINEMGADQLPWVWVGTALVMGVIITWYNRLVERYSRLYVVLGTCIVMVFLLVGFRVLMQQPGPVSAVAFYIFVDILGVVLVEQFWCLTNAIYNTVDGKNWYGLVGSGGLIGGVLGGAASALLLRYTHMQTVDLLLTAALTILVIFFLTWSMGKNGIYCEDENPIADKGVYKGWRAIFSSRYLLLIAAMLLLAQLASPLVEYQFMKMVEQSYADLNARTEYLSMFWSLIGVFSIAINIGVTPFVHRRLGVIAGLLVQPLLMAACSFGFFVSPTLALGAVTKISDRSLSHSIHRASKELLYVPINPILIYQAKAWIDMFGYRLFKVLGSFLILAVVQWLPSPFSVPQLSWFTITTCLAWIGGIFMLRKDYHAFEK